MSTEQDLGVSIVPQVEPVMVPTDGGQGEIMLEFPGASGSSEPAQPPPPPQPTDPQPLQPVQPTVEPVAAPVVPPGAPAPAVPTPAEQPPPDSRYLSQQVSQLQQQVLLGQQAMSQLQSMTTRIPSIEQALVSQAQAGVKTKEQLELEAMDKQAGEYFGDAYPMVKSLVNKMAEINTRRVVEPIVQQYQTLQYQHMESAKDAQCRTVATELIERGIPESEAINFVDTVRRHEATQQMAPEEFAHQVRSLGLKYLFGRPQASSPRPAQPPPTQAAPPAAAPVVPGVSPTIPSVPSTVLAAEAAKAGGKLQSGTGSGPGPSGTLSQADLEKSILQNAWEAQRSGW